ncbi:hypothetical protein BC832DRAFT_37388 [Gaertneriomyces semiglobifer]|nr:hypothetical protein BC832DRAFT_37388 [Gaertneriomyces semiglobifer]
MPVRSTSPPAPVRHAPPPPPPRGGGSGPTSPNMPRFTPPAPASRPAPPVPDRSSNATSRPAPPVPNRTGNLTPSGTVRGAPPPLPGVRAAFDKPPSVPTGLPARSTPPAPPGRPSTSISRGSTVNGSAMKSSFSSNSISSIDRRGSDGPYETDANGRWKFRTDLPPPRRFPTGEPYPNGPSAAANATASPSMSKRPPPPPPARRVSRAPPPPPSRSREGSVNQSAEVTRYVEDTVPKLEKELSASVARADFMRCQKLKDTIDVSDISLFVVQLLFLSLNHVLS